MTELTKDTKILIIGLGVIGGGYAKALTDAGYKHVRCITKNPADVEYAKNYNAQRNEHRENDHL